MIRHLLDTDIASYLIKGRLAPTLPPGIALESVAVSVITKAEILYGLARLQPSSALHHNVGVFFRSLKVLPWDEPAAERYAIERVRLESAGTPIGLFDTMIAAHALAAGVVLVTNNTRHFSRVSGLRIENWA